MNQRNRLKPRQQQVCAFLCGGATVKQAAIALEISNKTVEYHRAKIYERLGINDLVTLTKWALRNGLTTF